MNFPLIVCHVLSPRCLVIEIRIYTSSYFQPFLPALSVQTLMFLEYSCYYHAADEAGAIEQAQEEATKRLKAIEQLDPDLDADDDVDDESSDDRYTLLILSCLHEGTMSTECNSLQSLDRLM